VLRRKRTGGNSPTAAALGLSERDVDAIASAPLGGGSFSIAADLQSIARSSRAQDPDRWLRVTAAAALTHPAEREVCLVFDGELTEVLLAPRDYRDPQTRAVATKAALALVLALVELCEAGSPTHRADAVTLAGNLDELEPVPEEVCRRLVALFDDRDDYESQRGVSPTGRILLDRHFESSP
jgi:hypothetical protein